MARPLLEDDLPTGKGFVFANRHLENRGAIVMAAAVYVNTTSKPLVNYYGSFEDPLPDLP